MKFTEILKRFSVPYLDSGHEHCRPGWIQLDCPYCHQKDHWRLGYNVAGRYFHCWSCGAKDAADTLSELTNQPIGKCLHLLSGVERHKHAVKVKVGGKLILPKGRGLLLPAHRRFLEGRGFDPDEVVKVWGVQGIGIAPTHQWSIFIPVYYRGEVVSWTTRSISDRHGKRYRSASKSEERISHKDLLYGEDLCILTVVIVEGPLDAWILGPGAVSTLGTGYSRSQLLRMSKYPRRVVCFDAEPAAQRRAQNLCRQLEVFPGDTFNVVLEHGKDPSRSPEEAKKIVRRFLAPTKRIKL